MKESREADDQDVMVVKETKMDDGEAEVLRKKLIRRDSDHLLAIAKPHRKSHKPLTRTQSSPLVTFSMPPPPQDVGPVKYTFTTG